MSGLTQQEIERLALLAEELAESIQVVGKILRHGYESVNPLASNPTTNRYDLHKELGDVKAAIHLMQANKDLDEKCISDFERDKLRRLPRWLHNEHDGVHRF